MNKLIIIATICAFVIAVATIIDLQNSPNWACAAEDEVLIINNTCVHVDEL